MIPSSILILNVDDDDGARYVKTRVLKNAGFQVAEVATGQDALAYIKKNMPDLVVLDVKLPDISGLEVCRRIKAEPLSAAVLVLQTSAALTGRADIIRGLQGGADNYLVTPIEADELVANVNALLRLRTTQKNLQDSEERFRQLAESIDDVFWIFDVGTGKVLYVSPAYESMFNLKPDALLANSEDWLSVVFQDDRDEITSRFAAVAHEPYDREFRIHLPHDETRWVRDRAFAIKDPEGEVYRVARTTTDITTRKKMEGMLRAADEHKDEFLATLAHELRNPIGPIRNAIALMDMANPNRSADETSRKARDIIKRQTDHLAHLVDDLLDVARISRGKIALRLADVELSELVRQAAESLSSFVDTREQHCELSLPDAEVWVSGDEVRLLQAVSNLIHNASKFTPRHGRIQVALEVVGASKVVIRVSDNGIGITPDHIKRIFDMFTQSTTAPDKAPEGLGIGLSLATRLIELHGGKISAYSQGVGSGSTFTIELPLLRMGLPHPAVSAPGLTAAGEGEKKKILIVDDNPDASEMLGMLLTELGHTIEIAHDAKSTLAMIATVPDIIILDIGLPGINGYELAKILRARSELANVKLIALTGYGADKDKQKAKDAGFDAHLAKPADIATLTACLSDN
ncbi:response regulator [Undibacterium sp. TJN19]|uniref:hybrid sensor histidine kinase/response regulator n=1 Tax=Undibacterium sp. TJN19 TaxID=3413055 RepID=UPI003BF0A656